METEVRIPAGAATLEGNLRVPAGACGIVLFVHGSGSSRHSPRNQFVAQTLNDAGLATLLFDLLTPEEEAMDPRLRFDIGLLAIRLGSATDWVSQENATRNLRIGYFGASTGGGAAMLTAAERPGSVSAIVSRGGRPDLAGAALPAVRASTLLIVGDADGAVIGMNREAMARMQCEVKLELVPGATHLFEEPGALEQVGHLASEWFRRYLPRGTDE
ncbi:MAG TPA: dienelactone hydrolase family protein [Chthoniobacterales bacterium]|nr:dienelactone hydrolase family protein [Chthoniobacterales bacterium]